MKFSSTVLALMGVLSLAAVSSAAMIEGRINLGTDPGDFFDPASSFSQGATSHTNTISFTDGVVQVDLNVTAEAFDAGGSPAGLMANAQAAGVVGVDDDQIDAGESIKFTYNSISYSVVGPTPSGDPVDPASYSAILSSIRLAAFTSGTDTFTYTGLNAAGVTGDDTQTIGVVSSLVDGDMFTITGDSGAFRALYISHNFQYGLVPEPTSLAIVAVGLAGLAARRRR